MKKKTNIITKCSNKRFKTKVVFKRLFKALGTWKMKVCTGFSEPNHGSVVPKHTFAKKINIMEKGRSEAPRGMLFEVILEPLGRQIVGNGGF